MDEALKTRIISFLETMPAILTMEFGRNAWSDLVGAYQDGNDFDGFWYEQSRPVYCQWIAGVVAEEDPEEIQGLWECHTDDGYEFCDKEPEEYEKLTPPPVQEMAEALAAEYCWEYLLSAAEDRARVIDDWTLWDKLEDQFKHMPSKDPNQVDCTAWESLQKTTKCNDASKLKQLWPLYQETIQEFLNDHADIDELWFDQTDAGANFAEVEYKARLEGGEEPENPSEEDKLEDVAREFWKSLVENASEVL